MQLKLILLLSVILSFTLGFPKLSLAQTPSCQPVFGGGENCSNVQTLSIDKKILNPQSGKLVDDLGKDSPKYKPDFLINFELTVTNNSSKNISRVFVKDIFPSYIIFTHGPGVFDGNTKTLSFVIDNLGPKQTKIFTILGKVANEKSLPNTQVCVANQASATLNNTIYAQDSVQFCIDRKSTQGPTFADLSVSISQAPALTKTPPTGPNTLLLLTLLPIFMVGIALKKYKAG